MIFPRGVRLVLLIPIDKLDVWNMLKIKSDMGMRGFKLSLTVKN